MDSNSIENIINKYTQGLERYDSEIKGLSFHRAEQPTEPVSYMLSPHLCLIAQGVKHIVLGKENYVYDKNSFVLSSVDLPLVSTITKASRQEPYLGLTLEIDLEEIAKLITELNLSDNPNNQNARGIGISNLSQSLIDAVQRLLLLLDTPNEIPILAPVIKKEIYYRLLVDQQGYKLIQIASLGSQKNKISKAITWLKSNFSKPVLIKELANLVNMSESAFYLHFKALTGLSPLQYQKKIRLNESKRLMLVENINIANAAFLVGYESPTQFSREYKRMFGKTPREDIKHLDNINF